MGKIMKNSGGVGLCSNKARMLRNFPWQGNIFERKKDCRQICTCLGKCMYDRFTVFYPHSLMDNLSEQTPQPHPREWNWNTLCSLQQHLVTRIRIMNHEWNHSKQVPNSWDYRNMSFYPSKIMICYKYVIIYVIKKCYNLYFITPIDHPNSPCHPMSSVASRKAEPSNGTAASSSYPWSPLRWDVATTRAANGSPVATTGCPLMAEGCLSYLVMVRTGPCHPVIKFASCGKINHQLSPVLHIVFDRNDSEMS